MHWTHELPLHSLMIFTLVLVRVSALIMIAPIFGASTVPVRVRALMALALAAMIVPVELDKSTVQATSLPAYLVLAGGEALIGLALGLGVLVLFSGIQVAGQIISQMSGLQLADVYDPGFETQVPVLSQLLFHVTLAVFVAIGGHRFVLEALLDTFVWTPAGQGGFSRSLVEAMTSLLAQSFVLGIRAAAPAMVAVLLATLIVGLVGRTLPQLNVMALGFGLNVIVALVAVALSLGSAAWIFQEQLDPVLQTALNVFKAS